MGRLGNSIFQPFQVCLQFIWKVLSIEIVVALAFPTQHAHLSPLALYESIFRTYVRKTQHTGFVRYVQGTASV